PAAAAPATRVVHGKRVLVADDNATNLTLIREMLERDNHEVVAVASGQEALEALAGTDFELLLLDFNMHDVDGATVYETYRFGRDRKSTRLNSSHVKISYAVFCLKKKKIET